MSDEHDQMQSAFLGMWLGDIPEEPQFFVEERFGKLARDHGIPIDPDATVQRLLELTALAYWRETNRAEIDYPTQRKELTKLEKAAMRLATVLDEMPPDTRTVLHEASVARALVQHSPAEIVANLVPSLLQPNRGGQDAPTDEPDQRSDLARLRIELTALADHTRKARTFAGEGKTGRRDDDSVGGLMQMCFMIWRDIIGKDFTLAWYKKGPDSDAARFCVDVARIVDPKLSASRIETAARKARENDTHFNDLEKLTQDFDDFLKRMD